MTIRAAVILFVAMVGCATAPPAAPTPSPAPALPPPPDTVPAPPPVTTDTAPAPTITIAAVGDIMLGSTYPYTDGRDVPPPDERPAGPFTPFVPLLSGADLAFGNLEGAIVAADHPTAKPKCNGLEKGCFAFRMPPRLAPQLREAGFDVLSMANNHAVDFGEEGRDATRATLDALGIAYSGRRGDIARLTVGELRVTLVAMSNYEHSYLLNDLAEATAVIRAAAETSDIVIVSFHGGAEGPDRMRVPFGPERFLGRDRGDLRTFARAAVDAGADLVLGHGPHVVRAMEIYRDRLIAYSLGNFSTYARFNLTGPNGRAFLLEATLERDGRFVAGRAHALVQLGRGGPVPDPGGAALQDLRRLSREDFPETGADIGPDGAITRHGAPIPMGDRPPAPAPALAPASRGTAPPPGFEHIHDVHPHLRGLALALHERALAAGIPFRIVFGYTPYKRRSRPGPGGMATWHQFGLAFDVLIADRRDIADGKRHFHEDDADWQRLGAIAQELGLVWGGTWRSSYDPFHFEWHPGDDSVISRTDLRRFLALSGRDGREYRAVWTLYPAPDG